MTFREWFMESYGYDVSQAMEGELSAWNAALEEAAKVIENAALGVTDEHTGDTYPDSAMEYAGKTLCPLIRSLKETP